MSKSEFDCIFNSPQAALAHIDFFCIQFTDATEEARFYFNTLIKFIKSQEQKEVQHLESVAEKVPDHQKDEFWENHYPVHWKDIFEENLKASFVVSLLSTLESYLRHICQISHNGKSKKLDEYKKMSFPKKTHSYLKENMSVDISSLDWDTIYSLWRIRNIIAHNEGFCSEERDKIILEQFATITDGISISNSCIKIDPAFCKRALSTIRKFGIDIGRLIRDDLIKRLEN